MSFQKKDSSRIKQKVIALGEALVKELKLDPGVDTLSKWMIHYIAEQLTIIDSSTGSKKTEAETKCFKTILEFWNHRSIYPNGCRPFEKFELIAEALKLLHPENKHSFYIDQQIKSLLDIKKNDSRTKSMKKWLKIAFEIDEIARIWLDYIIKQATLSATDAKAKKILKLSINFDNNDDVSLILKLSSIGKSRRGGSNKEDFNQERKKIIKSRIKKLNAFKKFNHELLLILKSELSEIDSTDLKEKYKKQN